MVETALLVSLKSLPCLVFGVLAAVKKKTKVADTKVEAAIRTYVYSLKDWESGRHSRFLDAVDATASRRIAALGEAAASYNAGASNDAFASNNSVASDDATASSMFWTCSRLPQPAVGARRISKN